MKSRDEKSIFIVDDDQGILESFDAILGDDYPLVMVDNGTDAIRLLNRENPKLLFLDIKIPGPNGFEVLKKIRNNGSKTVVVMVSAFYKEHYQDLAQKYGIYKCLNKPFDVDEVKDIARRVLH